MLDVLKTNMNTHFKPYGTGIKQQQLSSTSGNKTKFNIKSALWQTVRSFEVQVHGQYFEDYPLAQAKWPKILHNLELIMRLSAVCGFVMVTKCIFVCHCLLSSVKFYHFPFVFLTLLVHFLKSFSLLSVTLSFLLFEFLKM